MSWQDYVDKQLVGSKCVTQGAIAGLDGNVWAKSDSFNVTKDELAKVVASFEDKTIPTSSGVRLAGERYIYLSGDDKIIRAKKGKIGVHVVKTKQAIVVAIYEDPIQPQQCALVVEKLGDYLVSCGY